MTGPTSRHSPLRTDRATNDVTDSAAGHRPGPVDGQSEVPGPPHDDPAARQRGESSPAEPAGDGTIRVLWTGGWDSSFRILQALLLQRRTVQPIYVVSISRASTMQELRAMEQIRAAVLPRLPDRRRLLTTQVHIGAQYPPRAELLRMRESVLRRGWIGEQYVNLTAVAEGLDWQSVEMSVERHEPVPSIIGREFVDDLGTVLATPERALFDRWSYPVIGLSKRDMADIAQEHGFLDLLQLRWFCHQPIRDKPCGRCRPCRLAVREDVEFANPVLAGGRAAYRRARRLAGLPTS